MSKSQKAIVDFRKLRAAALIPQCEFIITSMTGNTSFPTPPIPLTEVQALLDSYSAALSAAASRDRNKVALKNELRLQLNEMLTKLGNYVNLQSDGDITMIISSGFELSKLPQPRYISTPGNVKVKQGVNAGSLVCKIKADKAATSYIHMMSPAGVPEWTSVTTSRSRYEFTNLEQGKEYSFKVVVIGSNDQTAQSATVNQFAI